MQQRITQNPGRAAKAALLILIGLSSAAAQARDAAADMAIVPAGWFRPLLAAETEAAVRVKAFRLDRYAVTHADFQRFTAAHPEWRPGRPPRILADRNYLRGWSGDAPPPELARTPVVNVSWFAARAYCAAQGKRLPFTAEWELAAAAPDAAAPQTPINARILEWYGNANGAAPVGSVYRTVHGVYDLHGSIWEWTEDFTMATLDRDSRDSGQGEAFCGGGANAARVRDDYASFMRYALRSSLKARYAARNLGFRCAADL